MAMPAVVVDRISAGIRPDRVGSEAAKTASETSVPCGLWVTSDSAAVWTPVPAGAIPSAVGSAATGIIPEIASITASTWSMYVLSSPSVPTAVTV
jgi:hypothetical protein